ncbi:TPA: Flp family type IVb pilin [Vibrio vulnificus]|uniref:Flp family type IVb pilin n=1 Tax=Vibrio vulnificus TaxID=672 RepID=UPI000D3ED0B9|nr:pilus assembly protein PilA [Vibrio vulnificus]MDT8804091.1 pilus assembly protein PilA [Vibrio vulnificus]PUZ91605.1 pilus assembly protein PilA [Vibrio vulnificus]BDP29572.1 hypothetical protein VV208B2_06520 [Vibrio vulnificus]HAS6104078.1 pilus assembly protein PilA [Vibrio vulnificus]
MSIYERVFALRMRCSDFICDEEGLSVVEYVVGAALLVLAIGALFSGYDTKLNNKIDGALS